MTYLEHVLKFSCHRDHFQPRKLNFGHILVQSKIWWKPQNFACDHRKTLTFNNTGVLNGLKIQKIISVTKSVNRKNCGWQFSKLCVFLIVNRKNLTKNNFFSWFRKNVGEYSNHKNLRSNKQFFSEITRFCYKWHVSRWNIIFDYAPP